MTYQLGFLNSINDTDVITNCIPTLPHNEDVVFNLFGLFFFVISNHLIINYALMDLAFSRGRANSLKSSPPPNKNKVSFFYSSFLHLIIHRSHLFKKSEPAVKSKNQ